MDPICRIEFLIKFGFMAIHQVAVAMLVPKILRLWLLLLKILHCFVFTKYTTNDSASIQQSYLDLIELPTSYTKCKYYILDTRHKLQIKSFPTSTGSKNRSRNRLFPSWAQILFNVSYKSWIKE